MMKKMILILNILLDCAKTASNLDNKLSINPSIQDLSKNMVEIVITDLSENQVGNKDQKPYEASKEKVCTENTEKDKTLEPKTSQLNEKTTLVTKNIDFTDKTGPQINKDLSIKLGEEDNLNQKKSYEKDMPRKHSYNEKDSLYQKKVYEQDISLTNKRNEMDNLELTVKIKDNKEGKRRRSPVDFKEVVQLKNSKRGQKDNYKKCYIVWTNSVSISDLNKILEEFKNNSKFAKYVYTRNVLGFTVCTTNYQLLDMIKGKYVLINIEEDKTYRIASVENDKRLLHNMKFRSPLNVKDFQEDFLYQNRRNDGCSKNCSKSTDQGQQSPVPLHFYRISNLGNLFFNNYILDNVIFRILKINSLIKYFYRYNYFFSGKGVRITIIDTPKCNEHRLVNSSLTSGHGNSLAKNSNSFVIDAFSCNGTVKLSKLLDILENIEQTDVLVLPFSGPHSEVLDFSLKKISQKSIIVAASGNDSDNSCNYSPNGHHLIKVGSVDKHGYISSFSNRGHCTNLFSLGEDILNSNGTSHSASFVAGSVAMFLEKYPQASYDKVLQFLLNNSMKNNYEFAIFKIPILEPKELSGYDRIYYDWKQVIIFNGLAIIIIMTVILLAYKYYRRSRTASVDEQYVEASLR